MEENDNSTYHYFLVISPYLYFHFFSGLYISNHLKYFSNHLKYFNDTL